MERRSFIRAGLGSALAVGVDLTTLAMPTNPRAAWEVALAQHSTAKATFKAWSSGPCAAIDRKYNAWLAKRGTSKPEAGGSPVEWRRHNDLAVSLRGENPHQHEHEAVYSERARLADLADDAERAVMAHPAPDLAALRWKLENLYARLDDVPLEDIDLDPVMPDIRRLLGDA